MGPELALALAAGGTGVSMLGQQQAANDRRDILNRATQRTAQSQDKATSLVLGEGANYDPTKRAEAFAKQADTNTAQSLSDLKGGAAMDDSGNAIIDTAGDNGAVSKEYLSAKADKALSEGNRLSAVARELAKTRAPGQVVSDESTRRAGVNSDLNSMWSTTQNLNNADTLDAQNVSEPWWGQLGKIAAAVGSTAGMMPTAGASGLSTSLAGLKLGQTGATAGSGLNFGMARPGSLIGF